MDRKLSLNISTSFLNNNNKNTTTTTTTTLSTTTTTTTTTTTLLLLSPIIYPVGNGNVETAGFIRCTGVNLFQKT